MDLENGENSIPVKQKNNMMYLFILLSIIIIYIIGFLVSLLLNIRIDKEEYVSNIIIDVVLQFIIGFGICITIHFINISLHKFFMA